jgi:hypothetical protein
MAGLREFLDDLKQQGLAQGNLLGLLNVLIGRRITTADGVPVCNGVPWRVLAEALKRVRWDKEEVRGLGIDPAALAPRDRTRYWYQAIAQARVDSPEATQAGDALAAVLRGTGYAVGPAPGSASSTG